MAKFKRKHPSAGQLASANMLKVLEPNTVNAWSWFVKGCIKMLQPRPMSTPNFGWQLIQTVREPLFIRPDSRLIELEWKAELASSLL